MPVVVDPDPMVVETLLASMPAGSHGVESVDRLQRVARARTPTSTSSCSVRR